jgi:sensor histidine kinase YesM
VEYDIGAANFVIPALTLQPIAENAVQHGVMEREEGGTVRISSEETAEAFIVYKNHALDAWFGKN